LRVVRTFLDGVRDGLLVFLVGVVLFGAATACDRATNFAVPAAPPVVAFASVTAIASLTTHASRGGVVGQWGGAGGAVCEDHFGLAAGL